MLVVKFIYKDEVTAHKAHFFRKGFYPLFKWFDLKIPGNFLAVLDGLDPAQEGIEIGFEVVFLLANCDGRDYLIEV